ncbi:MAG: von Willebrand factor type A domain-containing protein [Candidatus Aminicenantes bacterium]|nr:von Willebrand factor type A domain-containing protein [Candidatus Aminicenantes bacterium]
MKPKFSLFLQVTLITVLITLAGCKDFRAQKDKEAVASPQKLQEAKSIPKMEMAPTETPAPSPVAAEPSGVKEFNTEEYGRIVENEFKDARQNPLSTFSIDVDKASYANIRRFITGSQLPPKDSVRIEEMINYFTYDYPQPEGDNPFSVSTEISQCPWNRQHKLVMIGLQGKNLDYHQLKPCNLVFLVDSSGSMEDVNKLPLLKQSLKLLVDGLDDRDKIAIVAYAGSAGLILPSTPASRNRQIIAALDQLSAGGTTAGGEGLQLAYRVAQENLIKDGNNRVILCTDGDFNVGVSSTGELVRFIEEKRKSDIYLTICGFGMGNYKDGRMEEISKAGNGNYFYIDNIQEAKKVFVKEMRANLFTIAKDVKIQVEFNPTRVKAYRLVGYENRVMANEDFNDDKKDAGELGAGHTVTALYEILPAGAAEEVRKTDDLKYQVTDVKPTAAGTAEIMTVKLRYKLPKEETSKLIEKALTDPGTPLENASENFRFSASVAGFGMLLRDSKFKGDLTYDTVLAMAKNSQGKDPEGYRAEFIRLVETCALLTK